MEPLGRKYLDKAAEGEHPEMLFMVAKQPEKLANRIRCMLGLPGLPAAAHEHALEMAPSGPGWGCDGCGCDGADKERFRCSKGCDFDFCKECNDTVGKPLKPSG